MTSFLESPREPLRPVVDSSAAFTECVSALEAGSGPVAIDAERAHGHRYWPKAYLFQLRREGAGTWLIDPIALEQGGQVELHSLITACGDATWLIHAASQDLPCMTEVGITPPTLFDTELAARLLGAQSAGLAALLEAKLGIRLRKAYSAANWATRPLPESWLIYAALDVDFLIELADALRAELADANRLEWAEQEFVHTLEVFAAPPAPRPDPWRRLSGLAACRFPAQLAVARAMWQERDRIARERDRPPGRILSDAAIVAVAATATRDGKLPTPDTLTHLPDFRNRGAQRYRRNWAAALDAVAQLRPEDYPPRRQTTPGEVPHPRSWERLAPERWEIWKRVRSSIAELACELGIQASLVAPPVIIRDCLYHWEEGQDLAMELSRLGARPWQVDFLAPLIAENSQKT
ncbi:MAG: HRDC domain-containing protein [Propionibacteriaceae bacterium]|nr:HRDC domain-containing protein [Propionibacteriaceae bacterium]